MKVPAVVNYGPEPGAVELREIAVPDPAEDEVLLDVAAVSVCGVPPTAKALSIDVTATQAAAAGHVRLFPAGLPVPTASTVNYAAGQTRAKNAIVPLNASAELAAFVGQPLGTTVHLIVDVNGYFQ